MYYNSDEEEFIESDDDEDQYNVVGQYLDGVSLDADTIAIPVRNQAAYIVDLMRFHRLSVLNMNATGMPIITGIPLSLVSLSCAGNRMTAMPELNHILEYLNCSGNQIGKIRHLPSSLKDLICAGCQLTDLPKLPKGLVRLVCGHNNLSQFPELPDSLEILDFRPMSGWLDGGGQSAGQSMNQFTVDLAALPTLPASLRELYLSGCPKLTALPALRDCAWLATLHISDCRGITVLPAFPSRLTRLECMRNGLRRMPKLPPRLTELDCSDNFIRTLPILTGGLLILKCCGNRIRALPAFPAKMRQLFCARNELTRIPPLPDCMIILDCSDNRLIELPRPLPRELSTLACHRNLLGSLPRLPDQIRAMSAHDNLIAFIPEIPESMQILQLNNHCYPVVANNRDCRANPPIARKINRFRQTFFMAILKPHLTAWMWSQREKIAMRKYAPSVLNALLANAPEDEEFNWD